MKLLFIVSLIAGGSFCLHSCGKKWKKPTAVSFNYKFNSNSSSGPVKFTSGYVNISKFKFTGERQQGDKHVELDQTFQGNRTVYLNSNVSASGINFDIPQGTYTKIELEFETSSNQNNASLQIAGTYITSSLTDTLAVLFRFDAGEVFKIQVQPSGGMNEILLSENKPASFTLIMNPNYWFAAIPQTMLDCANQTVINDVRTILVNSQNNDAIYKLIVNRIEKGNEAVED